MRAHRIDTFLIRENVRLEIIHESNSYFGGEHISVSYTHLDVYKRQKYTQWDNYENELPCCYANNSNSKCNFHGIDKKLRKSSS